MSDETKTMSLTTGDSFTLNEEDSKSLFKGVNLFLRNNGDNTVKVSTDGVNILITVEKSDK